MADEEFTLRDDKIFDKQDRSLVDRSPPLDYGFEDRLQHDRSKAPRNKSGGTVGFGNCQMKWTDRMVKDVHAHLNSYMMHLGGPEGFGFKLAVEVQAR